MWHVKFRVLALAPEPTMVVQGKHTTSAVLLSLAHLWKRVVQWYLLPREAERSTWDLRLAIHLHIRKADSPSGSLNGRHPLE
jgi:hypothetical protein